MASLSLAVSLRNNEGSTEKLFLEFRYQKDRTSVSFRLSIRTWPEIKILKVFILKKSQRSLELQL